MFPVSSRKLPPTVSTETRSPPGVRRRTGSCVRREATSPCPAPATKPRPALKAISDPQPRSRLYPICPFSSPDPFTVLFPPVTFRSRLTRVTLPKLGPDLPGPAKRANFYQILDFAPPGLMSRSSCSSINAKLEL